MRGDGNIIAFCAEKLSFFTFKTKCCVILYSYKMKMTLKRSFLTVFERWNAKFWSPILGL
jgi:hypothetical protein